MSMRDGFEKWADENWMIVYSPDDAWECWQAAYLDGAKAMQEEAAKRCEKDLYRGEHFAEVIRAINPENLLAVE